MKPENNHYIKKTFLLNWVIDDKFHYFDKTDRCVKRLGKNQANTQFTSLLINKNTENIINTNKIENDFEQAIKAYLQYEDFYKSNPKIPLQKLERMRVEKNQNIFNTSLDYISLQIARNPINMNDFFLILEEIVKKQSVFYNILPPTPRDEHLVVAFKQIFDEQPKLYKMLFDSTKGNIRKPHEFHFVRSQNKKFHLSEANTTSLSKLIDTENNFNLSNDKLENSYVTALCPDALLLLNCSSSRFLDEEVIPLMQNIEPLWTKFVINYGFEKIILGNTSEDTIKSIKNMMEEGFKNQSSYAMFKRNEAIYKKYYL